MGRIVAELPAQWLAAQAIVLIHDLEDIGPPWDYGGRNSSANQHGTEPTSANVVVVRMLSSLHLPQASMLAAKFGSLTEGEAQLFLPAKA